MVKKIPTRLETHGHVRVDDYYWLRERDNPEVIRYLNEENDFAAKAMAHTQEFEKKLFEEIKGRIKQTDMSVPYKRDDYFYYTRYEEGKEYPIYARKRGFIGRAPKQVMLDGNVLAQGHEFFAIGGSAVSSGQDLLAYAIDTQGRRIHTAYVKNLSDRRVLLPDVIPNVTENLVWANDNRDAFLRQTGRDHAAPISDLAPHCRHRSGDRSAGLSGRRRNLQRLHFQDQVEEVFDDRVGADDLATSIAISTRTIRAVNSQCFCRERAVMNIRSIIIDDRFIIRTNDQAKNFRLMATPVEPAGARALARNDSPSRRCLSRRFRSFQRSSGHGRTSARPDADPRRALVGERRALSWNSPSRRTGPISASIWSSTPRSLRFEYTSMKTPLSIYDYDMATRQRTLLKQEEVLGGFNPDDYVTERLYAPASDGTEIPLSLLYRKGLKKDGQNPTLLYGYGSYGVSIDAAFASPRLSLVDRGFVFAIAHIRGGQELGRQWYDDGKLLKKKNTFTDFIACAEFLIQQKFTNPDKLFAMGRSAGGLLMGAVSNLRPDLFKGIVAEVPFVDVVTTMLDASIPLTTGEYDEWGDPNKKEFYDYMLSYSPYDNVERKNYPAMLITGGLHDSQVQYWEPAKWVAKLRELKTDN